MVTEFLALSSYQYNLAPMFKDLSSDGATRYEEVRIRRFIGLDILRADPTISMPRKMRAQGTVWNDDGQNRFAFELLTFQFVIDRWVAIIQAKSSHCFLK